MREPDVKTDEYELYHGDCLEIMRGIGYVHLVFCDPPYNIGKADWDRIDGYFDWCAEWIAECDRVLKPNGAFWVSHSKPLDLVRLSGLIADRGRGLVNWITWDKYHVDAHSQIHALPDNPGLRSFAPIAEYLVYHADEGDWVSQCDRERGFIFEPLRKYLVDERDRAGLSTRDVAVEFQKKTGSRTVTRMAGHWFERVQWALPTEENYEWLRSTFHSLNSGGEYLKREYEDLRAEFESLRYTFNNPGKMSSVWQIPPAKANGHETPKPEELLRRIILATSNEGDTVLDPFMGSGTTGVACRQLDRKFIGIEINPEYFEIARKRIEAPVQKELL